MLVFSCKQVNKKIADIKIEQSKIVLDSIFEAEKFNPKLDYKPLSLIYKGKPIFSIGETTKAIDPNLSYRPDPNANYQNYFFVVKDFLSMDDDLSIELVDNSSINGIIFFSADQKEDRLFNVAGCWTFDLQNDSINKIALDSLSNKLFPILKNKIEFNDDWTFNNETQNLIEKWYITKESVLKLWSLNYKVELK